jgi:hypothetical protein
MARDGALKFRGAVRVRERLGTAGTGFTAKANPVGTGEV